MDILVFQEPRVTATQLDASADVNAQNEDDMSALIIAAKYNRNPEVMSVLLEAGADAKMKNKKSVIAVNTRSTMRLCKVQPSISDGRRRHHRPSCPWPDVLPHHSHHVIGEFSSFFS
jgi:hypothetical protein